MFRISLRTSITKKRMKYLRSYKTREWLCIKITWWRNMAGSLRPILHLCCVSEKASAPKEKYYGRWIMERQSEKPTFYCIMWKLRWIPETSIPHLFVCTVTDIIHIIRIKNWTRLIVQMIKIHELHFKIVLWIIRIPTKQFKNTVKYCSVGGGTPP